MVQVAKRFESDGYAVLEKLYSEEEDRVIDGRANQVPARDLI